MKVYQCIGLFVLVLSFASCKQEAHFISDPAYLKLVVENFRLQKEFAKERGKQLFEVFNQDLSQEEEEALKFLYAFMPMGDLADYDGNYFLSMVRASLEARKAMPWGKDVPEDIFRHFVLPYRVNNENLDTARLVFYRALKDRVSNLSMQDAILEVNHWCHEHVTYKGADIRTSAPLATLRTGTGRCGEESTFTVAALRSVGIPARQVYVPRWAHSDDNHAWVEAWADGEWHFLGGCEPAPQLDQGWFSEPARRAMLVHTKAFGAYSGPEEIIHQNNQYSELNVLSRYAETKKIFVKVHNKKNTPIEKCQVDFGLYNYAEFFLLASLSTDKSGLCEFTTGLGDLMIWTSKDGLFSCKKITVADTDTLTITLDGNQDLSQGFEMNLFPPSLKAPIEISEDGLDVCKARLMYEDSLRNDYESGFISKGEAFLKAEAFIMDKEEVWEFLEKSRGNWGELLFYLEKGKDNPEVLSLLETIADKDLRDTPSEILLDHLGHFKRNNLDAISEEEIMTFVLNPRIKNEIIVPYRSYFQEKFEEDFQAKCRQDIHVLVDWIDQNIVINNEKQYYDLPITPIGVYELKRSNTESRNIFFVAACRSFGIPSRYDLPTHLPQVLANGNWADVFFKDEKITARNVSISFNLKNDPGFTPEYYIHFTLAAIHDFGYKTLEFDYSEKWNDFPDTLKLFPGKYLLSTGNRLENGEILANLNFFELEDGTHENVDINIRTQALEIRTIAEFSLEGLIQIEANKEVLISEKEAFVAIFIDPDKEPTKHVFADMGNKIEDFNSENIPFFFILPAETNLASFSTEKYMDVPEKSTFCLDRGNNLSKLELQFKKKLGRDLPVILVFIQQGELVYLSHGYKIGLPDEILKYLKQMNID
ncbi:MAG: transglutaminase-like domain-containing protein [Bacteroidales bacterium]|nr:transglutaminase-like domain-containing protein [Bacteroidales bacterium]MCF8455213.1 transglutaminase-like domain-containing protein [Bacteroidales bacterium]